MGILDGIVEVDVPFLGKVKLEQLKKYVPLYIKLRKDPDVRALIPTEVDREIMKFARDQGIIDTKGKPRSLVDVDIPLRELEKNMQVLLDEGWSQTQVAKQLNVYPMVVHDYIWGKSIYSSKGFFGAWLKGVKQRLKLW